MNDVWVVLCGKVISKYARPLFRSADYERDWNAVRLPSLFYSLFNVHLRLFFVNFEEKVTQCK